MCWKTLPNLDLSVVNCPKAVGFANRNREIFLVGKISPGGRQDRVRRVLPPFPVRDTSWNLSPQKKTEKSVPRAPPGPCGIPLGIPLEAGSHKRWTGPVYQVANARAGARHTVALSPSALSALIAIPGVFDSLSLGTLRGPRAGPGGPFTSLHRTPRSPYLNRTFEFFSDARDAARPIPPHIM